MEQHEFTVAGWTYKLIRADGRLTLLHEGAERVIVGSTLGHFASEILRLASFQRDTADALALACKAGRLSEAAALHNQALAALWMKAHDGLLAWCQERPELIAALATAALPALPSPEHVADLLGVADREKAMRLGLRELLDALDANANTDPACLRNAYLSARALLEE